MTLEAKIALQISTLNGCANLFPCVTVVHNLQDKSVLWMSDKGLNELNIAIADLVKLNNAEYHAKYFNPEDAKDYVPKLLGLLQRNNNEECVSYFQQVRINKQAHWTWHLSSSKILMRDDNNNPVLMITQSIPIDSMQSLTVKAERTLQENNFLKENLVAFSKLTEREIEMLKCFANGESAVECGDKLFVSPKTVETHRKNIRKKLGTRSFQDLTKYARAFDLI